MDINELFKLYSIIVSSLAWESFIFSMLDWAQICSMFLDCTEFFVCKECVSSFFSLGCSFFCSFSRTAYIFSCQICTTCQALKHVSSIQKLRKLHRGDTFHFPFSHPYLCFFLFFLIFNAINWYLTSLHNHLILILVDST